MDERNMLSDVRSYITILAEAPPIGGVDFFLPDALLRAHSFISETIRYEALPTIADSKSFGQRLVLYRLERLFAEAIKDTNAGFDCSRQMVILRAIRIVESPLAMLNSAFVPYKKRRAIEVRQQKIDHHTAQIAVLEQRRQYLEIKINTHKSAISRLTQEILKLEKKIK